MLGIGRNLMLQLVKVKGFPAVRFKEIVQFLILMYLQKNVHQN